MPYIMLFFFNFEKTQSANFEDFFRTNEVKLSINYLILETFHLQFFLKSWVKIERFTGRLSESPLEALGD